MAKIYRKTLKKAFILLDQILPILVLIATLSWWTLPHVTLAAGMDIPTLTVQLPLTAGKEEVLKAYSSLTPKLPVEETGQIREPRYTLTVRVTAYNSHPGQTDSTPCVTASGLNVCERFKQGAADIIATNFKNLEFGTKIEFPDLYPGKIFLVHDRMNSRYSKTFDIWMPEHLGAKQFGVQWTTIKIY